MVDDKKAIYRAKLKAQLKQQRIDSPLVRYNESDQPVCKVCEIVIKSDSAWNAHQISAKHREAINILKAKAAAATTSKVTPPASTEFDKDMSEASAELSHKTQMGPPPARPQSALPSNFFDKTQMGPSAARPQSVLPSNFFDKPETKTQQNETATAKHTDNDKKKMGPPGSRDDIRVEVFSVTVTETIGDETQVQTRALPEGFFDDRDADLRARGITPVKPDIKDEYKEFEKLIQEDLKEVDNRMEEEEYDAAEMIEEAETEEQKACMEVVEMFKRKKMELKAARSGKRSKVQKVVEKESSSDESSSDEDSDDAIDWRAKHL